MDRRIRRELMEGLNRDAHRIASHFGLRYRKIEAERGNVTGHYGICYSDGTIRIRLRHAVNGKPLKYSSLVNTLCHELAHLRHFNHGPLFRGYYFELLAWARGAGIYRPGRRTPERGSAGSEASSTARGGTAGEGRCPGTTASPPVPEQLALF